MRAKQMVLGLALVSLLVALAAPAALAGGYSLGVSGGLSAPMSDFKDAFKTGYNGGATADYNINALFGIGIDAGYHSWKSSDAYNAAITAEAILLGAAPGTTVTAKLTALQYGVHARVSPPIVGPIHPYGQVGVDRYNLKQKFDSSDPSFTGDFTKDLFGFNVGAGVNYSLVPTTTLGILGQYHQVNAKDEFGANATWIAVNAVLTFHIPIAK